MEDYLSAQWESTSIRHAFIRKVRIAVCADDIMLISSEMFSCVLNRTAWFCVCAQVYLILAAQLAVTFSVVAVFTFV